MQIVVSMPGMNSYAYGERHGSALEDRESEDMEVEPGTTVADLLQRLGIGAFGPELVLVNGRQVKPEDELHDGDSVMLGGPPGEM